MTFNIANYSQDSKGRNFLLLHLHQPLPKSALELVESEDITKVIEIYAEKKKRTITANSYMWSLLGKIAEKTNQPLGNVYCKAIMDWGVFTPKMICKKEAYPSFEKLYTASATKVEHSSTLCYITKALKKGDQEWVEFNAFHGSSGYDKKEFSKLLNGVVADATELGIETLEDIKLKELVERMGSE